MRKNQEPVKHYRLKHMPKTCAECPFFEIRNVYDRTSEKFEKAPSCKLGYFWRANLEELKKFDMHGSRHPFCYIKDDKRVLFIY